MVLIENGFPRKRLEPELCPRLSDRLVATLGPLRVWNELRRNVWVVRNRHLFADLPWRRLWVALEVRVPLEELGEIPRPTPAQPIIVQAAWETQKKELKRIAREVALLVCCERHKMIPHR